MVNEEILNVSLADYVAKLQQLQDAVDANKKSIADLAAEQEKSSKSTRKHKEEVEIVTGSYRDLSKQLSELKKQWKNLEIGTEEWQKLGAQVNAINDQLKEADASVGVFSRNVGDYTNAFSAALDKSLDGLGRMEGYIAEQATLLKNLVPIIKNTATAATKGLKGIKAALASTGIGLLIIAVGELLAHWGDLMALLRKNNGTIETTEANNKLLNITLIEQNEQLENKLILLRAEGADEQQLLAVQNDLIASQMKLIQANIDETKAKIAELKAHSAFRRFILGENKDIKDLEESLKSLEEENNNLAKKQETNEVKITAAKIEEQKKRDEARKEAHKKEIEELNEILKRVTENSKTEVQRIREKYEKEILLAKKYGKDITGIEREMNKEIEKVEIERMLRSENMRKDYIKTLYGEDIANLAAGQSQLASLDTLIAAMNSLVETANKMNDEIGKTDLTPLVSEMDAVANATDILAGKTGANLDFITENFHNMLAGLNDAKAKGDAEAFNATLESMNAMLQEFRDKVVVLSTDITNAQNKAFEGLSADMNKTLSNLGFDMGLWQIADFEGMPVSEIEAHLKDFFNTIAEMGIDVTQEANFNEFFETFKNRIVNGIVTSLKEAKEETERLKQVELENIAKLASMTDNIFNAYDADIAAAQHYYDTLKQLQDESNEEFYARQLEAENRILDLKREKRQAVIEYNLDMLNSTNDVMKGLADLYEQNVEARKQELIENGKTEEEAEELLKQEFTAVQNMRIASATIDTISGAIAAFMGCQSLGQPWGAILGAIQAAAVTASGLAEIAKIKATKIGSGGNIGGGTYSSVNVTPPQTDFNPQYTANLTGASEQDNLVNAITRNPIKAYVVESDISTAQNSARAKQSQTTF